MITQEGIVLLKDVLTDFRLHPETHDQGAWICGTATCVAGSIALRYGGVPDYTGRDYGDKTGAVFVDGQRHMVSDFARSILLGFNGDAVPQGDRPWDENHAETQVLFQGQNTIDDLEAMLQVLEDGHHLSRRCPFDDWITISKELATKLPNHPLRCPCPSEDLDVH